MNILSIDNIILFGSSGFIGQHAKAYFSTQTNVKCVSLRHAVWHDIPWKDAEVALFLSGIAHETKKIPDEHYFAVNRDLAFQCAQQAKINGIKQFIYLSSVKVFGEGRQEPYTEESLCQPVGAYAKSKWEAEQLLNNLNSDDFIVSIIRPAVVYGSGVKGNIKTMMRWVNDLPILPFGNITAKRSIIFIGNLLGLIQAIMLQRAHGLFIAADEPRTSTEIIMEINNNLPKHKKVIPFPGIFKILLKYSKPGIYSRLFGDFIAELKQTRIKLNFTPPYNFSESIRSMLSESNGKSK